MQELEIQIKNQNLIIKNIEEDRKIRWNDYEKMKEKYCDIYNNLNISIAEFSGDLKAIKTDLSWIKENGFKIK